MTRHVVQSQLWGNFKEAYGTPVVFAGGVLYTKHKIPFSNYYYAYCPRVNPIDIDFDGLKKSLEENDCVAIHFDVPNVVIAEPESQEALKILQRRCEKSPRAEFAKANLLLDLTQSEEELLINMHTKQRYNIKVAQKRGVSIRMGSSKEDFDIFYDLYKETGIRQKFFYRPRSYLQKVWEIFSEADSVYFVTAGYQNVFLASWMLIKYESVLYYPYGGSLEEYKNVFASTIVGWESIRLGKKLGCTTFDMWGAAEDLSDTSDSYHGFSLFKSRFGAKHVKYIDSYDFVIMPPLYKIFNLANNVRWKVLNFIR